MHSDSMEGSVIGGRYRLKERIGVGGMSVVYRAMDMQTNRIVAIKTLKEEYCSDLDFVRRFQNEIKATSGLQHPNIVEIYDLGSEDGMPFIVMEFIEGITLKDYIVALQTVKWREALNVTLQVLSAVDCAHRHKVVHRDIKPQNIMITDAGQIKLTDFGIARVASSTTKPADADSAGSVHYLSPEQARGGFVDERSDIYSIGIMLYEMVTGVVPFDGESHVSIALKHIGGNIVPPHTVDPEIPYGVSDLIMMATNKNPVQRFQSAEEMYDRIQKVLENPSYSFLGAKIGTDETDSVQEEPLQDIPVDKTPLERTGPDYRAQHAEMVRSVTVTAIAYTLAVIVGVIGIVFIISRYRNLKQNMASFSDVQLQIEDYTGMLADAVVSSLTEKGIVVQKIPVEDDFYPVGYIVGQNLAKGTIVDQRTVLELQISSLSDSFVLENYSGSNYRDVGARLGALGVQVSYQPIASAKFENQMVVRTAPAAGSIIVAGTSVVVYYSTGVLAETVKVPNLTGLTLEEAQRKLELAGLRVGVVYPEPGSDINDLVASAKFFESLILSGADPDRELSPEDPSLPTPDSSSDSSPDPTESPSPSPSPELASERVVAQYPASGTTVYKYETVNLYFCNTQYLNTRKEMTFELPETLIGNSYNVRIEASVVGSSAIPTILYNATDVKRSEFPLQYQVTFDYSGAPVRVTIYINGQIYQELILYA